MESWLRVDSTPTSLSDHSVPVIGGGGAPLFLAWNPKLEDSVGVRGLVDVNWNGNTCWTAAVLNEYE